MPKESSHEGTLVFSYLQLRQAIGGLGLALPFVLMLGGYVRFGLGVQTNISHYYWTGMRDVLVGTLFAIGFFLLAYRGHDQADNLAGNLGGAFALGMALFPTTKGAFTDPTLSLFDLGLGIAHLVFAALFFGMLIYFCLVLFPKTDQKRLTKRKVERNRIYRACGWTMAACLALTAVASLLLGPLGAEVEKWSPVYWLEAIAIIAFGLSWIVKGQWILKDE